MEFQSTSDEKIESTQCCVVYEKATGKVRLVYESLTLEGGQQKSEDDFRRLVRDVLRKLPPDLPSINPDTHDLLFQKDPLEPGATYIVDIVEKTLVQVKRDGTDASRH